MRSLIIFFISLVAFSLVIFVLALLLPSSVGVTRTVIIKAPKEKISEQIGNFSNWQNWYPPMQDKSVGLVEKSDDEALLKDSLGREIVLKMNKSTSDTINVAFESLSSSKIVYQFIFMSKNADSTHVALNVHTTFKWYPWQKLKGIVLDKMTGPMYEEMLENLKREVEPLTQPLPGGRGAKPS